MIERSAEVVVGQEDAWFQVAVELRRRRTARGMSLSELARQVHYSTGYLSKIETGKKRITLEVACLVDEALDTGGALVALLPSPRCPSPRDDEAEPSESDVCPYPGLAAFGPQDAQWFFGRDEATSYLINRLDVRLGGGGPLAVVSSSGAGKSSLLAAGLIPALTRGALTGSRAWLIVTTTPRVRPLETLVARIAERTGTEAATVAAAIADPERFTEFLIGVVGDPTGKTRETPKSPRIVLIIDQFEETFTECQDESERQAFIAALCTVADSSAALVVLGIRADFYGSCLTYPPLVTALRDPVVLGPMSAAQLREIIIGPAEAEGFQVEPGLVELLLRDLGVTDEPSTAAAYAPGSLPLLAHALRVTWQQRNSRVLTVAAYQRTGGIRKAIAITAENAYTRLSPSERQIAQQLLLRLVHVNASTGEVRRRLPRDRLLQALSGPPETTERVLEIFGRARMLTFDSVIVEITHEALLRAWPRLADWISADQAGLRIHQALAEATDGWEAENRDPSLLYRGPRLTIAQDWAGNPGRTAQLSASERAFLDASVDQKQAEQRTERRRTRRLRTLVGVLAVSLTVALVAGGIAFQQYHIAASQRYLALVGELIANSQSQAAKDPAAAMVLAVEAYHLEPTSQALSTLLSAQSQYYSGQLLGHTGVVYATAYSHDGRMLVTASADGTARVWDPASHHLLATLTSHTGPIGDAEFSPDDRTLVTADRDGAARLWDVATAALIGTFTGQSGIPVGAAKFSHDGRSLATANRDGSIFLWDVATRGQIAQLTGHTGAIFNVEFSPDDRILATASSDGTARLWDTVNHQALATLAGLGRVNDVAFSPNGRILAVAGHNTNITLWDTTSRQLVATLAGHTGPVNSVVFSPDGNILASGGGDGTARLWNVATHQQISTLHAGSSIIGVAFSPDGHTLATGSEDDITRLWSINGPILIPSPSTISLDAKFSPDGRIIAIAGEDGTVRLYDVANHNQIVTLAGHSGPVESVAFSPDGHILATAGADGTAQLWDVASHLRIASLDSHVGLRTVAFNHDGRILVSAGDDGVVRLWDAASHQLTATLGGSSGIVYTTEFDHGSDTLASAGSDGVVRLWDAASHRLTAVLTGTRGTINRLAFSPNDRILATAAEDGIRLWDVAGRRQIAFLTGHAGAVRSVAFSKDGNTLVTAGSDATTKLWDVPSRQLIATLTGHVGDVYGVTSSPSSDGRLLATVGGDTTVRLWDLDPNRVTDRICHVIGTISPAQWARLIPELPYQPTCR